LHHTLDRCIPLMPGVPLNPMANNPTNPNLPGLLVTRPDPAGEEFVHSLSAELRAGLQIVISPLLELETLIDDLDLGTAKGVIFTSKAAVRALRGIAPAIRPPAYCVGQATCDAATELGWSAQRVGQDAESLISGLLATRPDAPLLHIRGRHARGDIAMHLRQAGLPCEDVIAYDQKLLPLTEAARALLVSDREIIVPLFSPRTARQFADTCPQGGRLHLIAMSKAVAHSVKHMNYSSLIVPPTPDATAMRLAVTDCAAALHRVEGGGDAQ
jgi:uroporphyrinogen-III synthase